MEDIETLKKVITSANILEVEVGTNCPQGGDAGHGGRTYLKLSDGGGTAWGIRVNYGRTYVFNGGPDPGQVLECRPDSVTLVLGGDTECETLIQALRFAADTLEMHTGRNIGEGVELCNVPHEAATAVLFR